MASWATGGVLGRPLCSEQVRSPSAWLFSCHLQDSWNPPDLAWRLFLAGCGIGLFNAPNMAVAMGNAPRRLLAPAGASPSLARTMGFALGPALATLAWSTSSYGAEGMRAAMALATAFSACSVAVLLRHRVNRRQASGAADGQRIHHGSGTARVGRR